MIRKYLGGALLLSVSMLMVGPAYSLSAARVPASAGRQVPDPSCAPGFCGAGDNVQCFDTVNGQMYNNCTDVSPHKTRRLVIPLQSVNPQSTFQSFVAFGRGNGSTATSCQAILLDGSNSAFSAGGSSRINSTFGAIGSGSATVSTSNAVTIDCQVAGLSGSIQGAVLYAEQLQ